MKVAESESSHSFYMLIFSGQQAERKRTYSGVSREGGLVYSSQGSRGIEEGRALHLKVEHEECREMSSSVQARGRVRNKR